MKRIIIIVTILFSAVICVNFARSHSNSDHEDTQLVVERNPNGKCFICVTELTYNSRSGKMEYIKTGEVVDPENCHFDNDNSGTYIYYIPGGVKDKNQRMHITYIPTNAKYNEFKLAKGIENGTMQKQSKSSPFVNGNVVAQESGGIELTEIAKTNRQEAAKGEAQRLWNSFTIDYIVGKFGAIMPVLQPNFTYDFLIRNHKLLPQAKYELGQYFGFGKKLEILHEEGEKPIEISRKTTLNPINSKNPDGTYTKVPVKLVFLTNPKDTELITSQDESPSELKQGRTYVFQNPVTIAKNPNPFIIGGVSISAENPKGKAEADVFIAATVEYNPKTKKIDFRIGVSEKGKSYTTTTEAAIKDALDKWCRATPINDLTPTKIEDSNKNIVYGNAWQSKKFEGVYVINGVPVFKFISRGGSYSFVRPEVYYIGPSKEIYNAKKEEIDISKRRIELVLKYPFEEEIEWAIEHFQNKYNLYGHKNYYPAYSKQFAIDLERAYRHWADLKAEELIEYDWPAYKAIYLKWEQKNHEYIKEMMNTNRSYSKLVFFQQYYYNLEGFLTKNGKDRTEKELEQIKINEGKKQ